MSGTGNPLKRGRHRKPSSTQKTLVRTVVAGAVVGAPLATAGTAQAASDNVWDRVAQCESSGNWSINSGNGFQGGLQFTQSTWRGFGGAQFASAANRATRAEQIAVAEKVLAGQGWGAWPVCSRKAHAVGQPATPRVVTARAKVNKTGRSIGGKVAEAEAKAPSSAGRHALRPDRTVPLAHPPIAVTQQPPAARAVPVAEVAGRLAPLVQSGAKTPAPAPLTAMPMLATPTPAHVPAPAPAQRQAPAPAQGHAPVQGHAPAPAQRQAPAPAPVLNPGPGAPPHTTVFAAGKPPAAAPVAPAQANAQVAGAPAPALSPQPGSPAPGAAGNAAPPAPVPVALAENTRGARLKPAAVPAPRTYQVRPGDTLSSIARGNGVSGGWQAIYQTNRGSMHNANLIRPGQMLTLG